MDQDQGIGFMRQALRLAAQGAGWVAPNPLVGAVIVKNGQVIGRGYHRRFGRHHAEVNALQDCTQSHAASQGATMFVTLEPCCHVGKTPACTEAIIEAGIARVEIATLDDNPQVAGKGARQLADQGIIVSVGCCEQQARLLNAGYFKIQKCGEPLVILKWAQSIDGKLAWQPGLVQGKGQTPQRQWISNPKSRRHVHRLRGACGAILAGIGTVLADDPMLSARGGRSCTQPLRVILDRQLRLPFESQLAQTASRQPVLVCARQRWMVQMSDKVAQLQDLGCQFFALPHAKDGLELRAVLTELCKRGVTDLLVEGGPRVLASFLAHRLADKLVVFIAPMLLGDQHADAAPAPEGLGSVDAILTQLRDVRTRRFDDDIMIEAYLRK